MAFRTTEDETPQSFEVTVNDPKETDGTAIVENQYLQTIVTAG